MHTAKQLINKLNELHLDHYEMASDINEDVAIQLVDFEQLFLFLKKHNVLWYDEKNGAIHSVFTFDYTKERGML